MAQDPEEPATDEGERVTSTYASWTEDPRGFGPYRILEKIGEGGMGVVYLAEQESPIRRRVALKVIKPGMDSRQVLARFEAERQALALMSHPNVARVLDAGTTPHGHPYFVMEHVAGIPITGYCDKHTLGNRQRLELFIQVCDAIQHAHQKGIVHRDIKPSNVLVALESGKPVPKVIDFGVAKAMNQRLTERTLFTEQGVLIGTPEYMSPEQAEMTALDVDARSDIYSLGVLLYELLVGALPFDPRMLRRAALHEIQRIIRETDPPKPSSRVNTLGGSAREAARQRHTSVRGLRKSLKGELDWITLRAMEKDRTRRYASASELAADVRNHLEDAPVLAGPPTTAYRLAKIVKRHRVGLSAALALVLLSVTVGNVLVRWKAARGDALRSEEAAALAELQSDDSPDALPRSLEPVLRRVASRILEGSAQPLEHARFVLTAIRPSLHGRTIQRAENPIVEFSIGMLPLGTPDEDLAVLLDANIRVNGEAGTFGGAHLPPVLPLPPQFYDSRSDGNRTVTRRSSPSESASLDLSPLTRLSISIPLPRAPGRYEIGGIVSARLVRDLAKRLKEDPVGDLSALAKPGPSPAVDVSSLRVLSGPVTIEIPTRSVTVVESFPDSYPMAIADGALVNSFLRSLRCGAIKVERDRMGIPQGQFECGFDLPALHTVLDVTVEECGGEAFHRLISRLRVTNRGCAPVVFRGPMDVMKSSSNRRAEVELSVTMSPNQETELKDARRLTCLLTIRSNRDAVLRDTDWDHYLAVDTSLEVPLQWQNAER